MDLNTTDLPLAKTAGGCGCGDCGCGTSETAATAQNTTPVEDTPMNTQTFSVTGMTCGHCVGAVTSELKEIPGVTEVTVDLVAGGTSAVTVASQSPVDGQAVVAALDEAGEYQLATS